MITVTRSTVLTSNSFKYVFMIDWNVTLSQSLFIKWLTSASYFTSEDTNRLISNIRQIWKLANISLPGYRLHKQGRFVSMDSQYLQIRNKKCWVAFCSPNLDQLIMLMLDKGTCYLYLKWIETDIWHPGSSQSLFRVMRQLWHWA